MAGLVEGGLEDRMEGGLEDKLEAGCVRWSDSWSGWLTWKELWIVA